jgi:predicted P-loop ATPase/GTPase
MITDFDRNAFAEVGSNTFLNYKPSEADRLREIAEELRKIVADAKKRQSTSSAR